MQNTMEFNSLAFITAGGPVSILVAVILLIMSVASWYLMLTKGLQVWRMRQQYHMYLQKFWQSPNLITAMQEGKNSAFLETAPAKLAGQSVAAAEHYREYAIKNASDLTQDDFIARAMNRSIIEESARLESGLTVLASVGSVSPFVGLFGTVWGIYHALASISQSGQATLDKVAGPVGEALIMTALGLAVAIPAVLAYNAFLRNNRNQIAQLEQFAYELHTLLTTGAVMHAHPVPTKQRAMKKESIHAVEVPA